MRDGCSPVRGGVLPDGRIWPFAALRFRAPTRTPSRVPRARRLLLAGQRVVGCARIGIGVSALCCSHISPQSLLVLGCVVLPSVTSGGPEVMFSWGSNFQRTDAHSSDLSPLSPASVAPRALVWRSILIRDTSGSLAVTEVDLGAQTGLHSHFWDHTVSGRALFPAAGFLELACGACRVLLVGASAGLAAGLMGVSIPSPCLLSAPGAHVTVLRAEVSLAPGGLGRFHISGGRAAHVSGSISTVAEDACVGDDGTSALPASPQCCVGAVELTPPLWWESGCWSPPAAVDGAMQLSGASAATGAAQARTTRVPAAAGAFCSTAPLKGATAHAVARVGASAGGDSGASSFSSHRLVAGTNSPTVELCDLEARPLRRQAAAAVARGASAVLASEPDSCLYELEWQVCGFWMSFGTECPPPPFFSFSPPTTVPRQHGARWEEKGGVRGRAPGGIGASA